MDKSKNGDKTVKVRRSVYLSSILPIRPIQNLSLTSYDCPSKTAHSYIHPKPQSPILDNYRHFDISVKVSRIDFSVWACIYLWATFPFCLLGAIIEEKKDGVKYPIGYGDRGQDRIGEHLDLLI